MERIIPHTYFLNHHHDAHLGSLVLCQGFYQLEAKGYPHRPNEVECHRKGWQAPHVGFGRYWSGLVATWGHASSADCQRRGLQDPSQYNESGTLNKKDVVDLFVWTYPQESCPLLGPLWCWIPTVSIDFRIHQTWQFGFQRWDREYNSWAMGKLMIYLSTGLY